MAKMAPWHSSRCVTESQGGRRRGLGQDGGWAGSSASCPEPHRIPQTHSPAAIPTGILKSGRSAVRPRALRGFGSALLLNLVNAEWVICVARYDRLCGREAFPEG